MKLQKHFFLSITLLFSGIFGVSLFLESFLTEKHLQRAAEFFHDFVVKQYQKENKGFSEYLNFSLQSLLKDLFHLRERLPKIATHTEASLEKKSSTEVSVLTSLQGVGHLFQEVPWINYVSFHTGGTAYAVFYPYSWQDALFVQEKNPGIYYIFKDVGEEKEVFVGVPLEEREELVQNIQEQAPQQAFAFFSIQDFLRFTKSEIENTLSLLKEQPGFVSTSIQNLFQYILQKGGLVEEGGLSYPPAQSTPEIPGTFPGNEAKQALIVKFLDLIAVLEKGGVKVLPKIIGHTSAGPRRGEFFFREPLWIEEKQTPEDHVILKMPERASSGKIGALEEKAIDNAFLQIISSPHAAFLVQHLSPQVVPYAEQLSVGVSMNVFLEGLLDLQYQSALFVYQGKVFDHVGAAEEVFSIGTEIPKTNLQSGFLLQEANLGASFYSAFYPFQTPDFCVLVRDSRRDLQQMVQNITKEGRRIVQKLSTDMRVIAIVGLFLFALLVNTLIKRIIAPIILLVEETHKVGAGQLDKIVIPEPNGYDEMVDLCASFTQMIQDMQEKEKVKGVLNKVVSTEIAKEILKGNVHLGGEEQCVTVFFADIRHFTQMSQKLSPKEVIDLLNGCMTEVSQAVDDFGGVIDKYVGDGVMALFGAPVKQEDSALRAILCASETVEKLALWNKKRENQGLQPVQMGFGLHYGNVLVGNMGAENRLSYTVIGNNVNLAARICGAAEGMQILITPAVWEAPQVQEHIVAEPVPSIPLKGYDTPVRVLRVVKIKKKLSENE